MTARLQVLRTIDKADRLPPRDIFSLLTRGRTDQSGAFFPGCGMGISEAIYLTAFVFMTKQPRIWSRVVMLERLEASVVDAASGRTALDCLLDAYAEMPEPKNIGWLLDDLVEAARKPGGTP